MSAKKDISKEFDKISDGAKQVQKKRKSLTGGYSNGCVLR